MKDEKGFSQAVEEIILKDPRYNRGVYGFVLSALGYTQAKIGEVRHVTGQELLEGIGEYILEEYGVMARTVLEYWGVKSTEDFGNIVFNMVEADLLSKTEEDSIEDFKDGYNFKEVFDMENIKQIDR